MNRFAVLPLALLLMGQAAPQALAPGIWTNEEDRYFAQERKAPQVPEWTGFEVATDSQAWRRVDSFGKPLTDWRKTMLPAAMTGAKAMTRTDSGISTELRRGAEFKCWVSIRRHAAKPDGSPDWTFHPGLKLHDAGGRALAQDPAAPPVVIRLRNVIWPPPSTNKPSLVLYVHKPDEPEKAVSYAWADPQAKLIGINLRWMQGSCTREETK
jgi:hypothetical protein